MGCHGIMFILLQNIKTCETVNVEYVCNTTEKYDNHMLNTNYLKHHEWIYLRARKVRHGKKLSLSRNSKEHQVESKTENVQDNASCWLCNGVSLMVLVNKNTPL